MTTNKQFIAADTEKVFEALDSHIQGLSYAEADKRLKENGPNEIESGEKTSKIKLLLAQLTNPLVLVLVATAVISLIADHAIDAIVIGVIIVINALIGYFQEAKAEDAIEALRSRAAPKAAVLRRKDESAAGETAIINSSAVVVGDVIVLQAGDKVPADARLFEAVNLLADESMLTGESLPVEKHTNPLEADLAINDWRNVVFSSSTILKGRGKAVVYATAEASEIGKISTLLKTTESKETPLQRQTGQLGKVLAMLAGAMALATFVLGYLTGYSLQEMLLFSLASAVSSIPEGLPAVMTITLAVGVNRMAQRNVIIRKLRAVDTLGAATMIVTDKTGTLTTNKMTVSRIYSRQHMVEVKGDGNSSEGKFCLDGEPMDPAETKGLRRVLEIGVLCNDSQVKVNGQAKQQAEVSGDPTETAMVIAALKAGFQKEELEKHCPRIDEIPFDSKNKYMVTFHRTDSGTVMAMLKGAPEVVLGFCSHELAEEVVELTESRLGEIHESNVGMAERALRVLAMAYQEIEPDEVDAFKERVSQGEARFVLAGMMGMIDPPRPHVKEAVAICKKAGIRVIMATGDQELTAKVIARDLGILEGDDGVISGAALEEMSDDELDEIIDRTAVFARVSPEHKYRLVQSLQRKQHVVGMTGDGVNDAPALNAAQVGISMGITGTDVAREASEMVLTDDHFASIVNAVEEGRVVFQNVRKVVKFLLATNFGEDLTILGSFLFFRGVGLILTPVQVLWINLVTDGILDITIALEPKEGDVMLEPPRKVDSQIINREIIINTLIVALIMAAGSLFVFGRSYNGAGLVYARTMLFTTLAMFQVFNAINVRSRKKSIFELGLFSNPYLLGAMIVSVALQFLTTQTGFMNTIMGTVPLSLKDYALILPVSFSVLVVDEARKWVQRRLAEKRAPHTQTG